MFLLFFSQRKNDDMLVEMIENSRLRCEYESNSLRPSLDVMIEKLRDFEATAGEEYAGAFTRVKMKKGSYLLREGEVSYRLWFLEEGLARLFMRKNNEEITSDFFFSSEFVDLYDSSSLHAPSNVNIQLLTDSVLYVIKWEYLELLKKRYPVLAELEKLIIACYIRGFERRILNFQSLSSTEKYVQLMNAHPYMVHQVSLTQIASYLGMTEATLSRIRSKINK